MSAWIHVPVPRVRGWFKNQVIKKGLIQNQGIIDIGSIPGLVSNSLKKLIVQKLFSFYISISQSIHGVGLSIDQNWLW